VCEPPSPLDTVPYGVKETESRLLLNPQESGKWRLFYHLRPQSCVLILIAFELGRFCRPRFPYGNYASLFPLSPRFWGETSSIGLQASMVAGTSRDDRQSPIATLCSFSLRETLQLL